MSKLVKCVVPVSGGKDSQACLQLAVAHFGKEYVIGLFCDTQFEHPLTYAHVERMASLYDVEIVRRCEGDVLSLCERTGRFPSGIARFCTNELKINVSKKFYKQLAEQQGQGFEVWYGMRTDESHERAKRYEFNVADELIEPHLLMPSNYPKYLANKGVMFRLPIIDWDKRQVLEFLDGKENPLYAKGFDRVGCFPCLAGGDASKERAFHLDEFGESQFAKVRDVERKIGKNVFTSKGGQQRNNPDQLCLICQI